MESRSNNRIWLLLLCLLLIFMISCGSEGRFIGKYRAEVQNSPKRAGTDLELKSNGDGAWRVGDEEVAFSWYVKGGELRFNTKTGGVIVGTFENNAINIILPDSRVFSFKKIQ